MECDLVFLTFVSDQLRRRLVEVLAIRPVADDRHKPVGGEAGDLIDMDLRSNSAGLAETVDSQGIKQRREEFSDSGCHCLRAQAVHQRGGLPAMTAE